MLPSERTNPLAIIVLSVIGFLGLVLVGILAWFVLWFLPHAPRTFDRYARQGNSRYEQGDYQGAIESYNRAIKKSPHNSRGYFLRGWANYKAGSYKAALADYDLVLKYATENDIKRDAHFNRGGCFRQMHQWANAIPEYTASIRLGEAGADVYGYRGDAYSQTKDYRHALNDLNTAIDADPKVADLYASRGSVFLGLHQYSAAVRDISYATRWEPDNAPLRGNLGWAQYLAGKEDVAIQTDRQVLTETDLGWVHANLGLCYAAREDWAMAQPEYAQAAKLTSAVELAGATQDVRDALKKKPNSVALKNALSTLITASRQRPAKGPRRLLSL